MYPAELLREIRELLNTEDSTLWKIADIAEYLNFSISTVQNRFIVRPDFPAPYMFSELKSKRWEPEEVRNWARSHKSTKDH